MTASLRVPGALSEGTHTLAVSLVDPAGQRRPCRLAFDAPESEERYTVGTVHLE